MDILITNWIYTFIQFGMTLQNTGNTLEWSAFTCMGCVAEVRRLLS